MRVPINKQFTDNGSIYEILPNFDRPDGVTTFSTFLFNESGYRPIAETYAPQDWPLFYERGWTEQECRNSLKNSWILVRDRECHIGHLKNFIKNDQMDDWLKLDTWDILPTEVAFRDWMLDEFEPAWNNLYDGDDVFEPDFDEKTARLFENVEHLEFLMETHPELIQIVE